MTGRSSGIGRAVAGEFAGAAPRSSPDHISVGLTSTRRFMRLVCWQSAPRDALPLPLRDEIPAGIWRGITGRLTDGPVSEG